MPSRHILAILLVSLSAALFPEVLRAGASEAAYPQQSGFPIETLSGVEFASPTVIDLDGDGGLDVLTADGNGCVWAWTAAGTPLPGYPLTTAADGDCSGNPRINGPLAVGDVDGDGRPEIAAGTRGTGEEVGARGKVFLWNAAGALLPGWPQEMDWNTLTSGSDPEVYTVALANITGDFRLEILAGTSNNASQGGDPDLDNPPNVYAWHADGTPVSGFPAGYRTAGVFGQLAAGDLTGDGLAELIVGRDHLQLNAYLGTEGTVP